MTESSNGLEEDFTEPSTFKSALSRAGGRARRRWFWLINLALLLLFLWTLTEESAVHVQVEGGTCTAVFPEGRGVTRSSSIPCPGLGGGFVGLTFRGAGRNEWLTRAPLDWLLPRSGWRSVAVSELGENGRRQVIEIAHEVPGWRRLWGEWQPLTRMAAMQWQTPIHSDYQVSAALRRPEEPAGILLLQPDSKSGWAFITDPANRRGAWWEWHDGRLGEPLVGIPYQKPLLAQAQSLLRRLLRAQQGALLLLFAGWLAVILSRRLRGGKFKSLHSITFDRLWPLKGGRERLALLVLALAACGAAAIIAALILERMPHVQDSLTYLFQAQLLAQGRLWADAPPLPEFFEHEFLAVSDSRWFGQYPPGFPFLLAIGVRLGQPWLINPILAGLTLVLLYLLGKALYGRSTGFIAAVLALTSPFLLFMSGTLMAHPAELFWVTMFMLSWTYALQREGRHWPLLAGLALGMIFLTRQPTAAATALPFLLVMLIGRGLKQRQWRPLAQKAGWLLLTAVPVGALLFFHQAALTGDPFRDPRTIARPFDRIGFGLAVGEAPNAFQLHLADEIVVVDWIFDAEQPPRGHTPARGLYNSEQNIRLLERQLFGWLPPMLSLAFIWLAFLAQRPAAADWALLASFSGTVFVYIFYWNDGIMYGPRYYYGALPALLLLTARGIQAAARLLGRDARSALALIVALLITFNLALTFPALVDSYRGYNFISGQERALVEQQAAPPAIIFVENNPLNWWEYGRFFSANTPTLDGPIIYARDLGPEQNESLQALYPHRRAYLWQFQERQLLPLPE